MKELSDIKKRLYSDYWPTRSSAVRALKPFDTKAILPLLEIAMEDEHKYIRQAALELMADLAQKDFESLLKIGLKDEYHYNRELAFGAMVNIYTPTLFPILEAAINRKGEQIDTRVNMIWKLASLNDQSFTPVVLKWAKKMPISSVNAFVLMEVVKAFQDRTMIPDILTFGQKKGQDAQSKNRVVDMLGSLKATEGVDYILEQSGHKFATDVYSDSTCLEALVNIDAPALYLELLDDYKGRKRNLLVEAIGLLDYKNAVDNLTKRFVKNKEINYRLALAKSLQKLGYKANNKVDEVLLAIASDSWDLAKKGGAEACLVLGQISKCYHNKLARKALEILGDIGQVDDLDSLIRQIKSRDARKRINAINALGKIGSKDAIPALVSYIHSGRTTKVSYDNSKEKAIYALGKIGDLSVIPFLLELLKTDPSIGNKNNFSTNGRALIRTLVEFHAEEAIPTILLYLNHKNRILREESVKALEAFDWKPNHLQNKIRWLSAKKEWDAISAIGPMMVKPLISLTSNDSIYAYEKLMLALAKIGDQQATSHILLWLFKPYYRFHDKKRLTNLKPFLEPLLGELTTAILEASSFIDCVHIQESLSFSSYTYSLKTAIKATQKLMASDLPLAKKVLGYIPLKKPVQLVDSEHEEYGGGCIMFDFKEQIDILE